MFYNVIQNVQRVGSSMPTITLPVEQGLDDEIQIIPYPADPGRWRLPPAPTQGSVEFHRGIELPLPGFDEILFRVERVPLGEQHVQVVGAGRLEQLVGNVDGLGQCLDLLLLQCEVSIQVVDIGKLVTDPRGRVAPATALTASMASPVVKPEAGSARMAAEL